MAHTKGHQKNQKPHHNKKAWFYDIWDLFQQNQFWKSVFKQLVGAQRDRSLFAETI